MRMSREDQEEYMKLHNNYNEDIENWSERMRFYHQSLMRATNGMAFPGIAKEKEKVWAINNTNGFSNGVYLKMSRFNHSCQPNTEHFWNDETNTLDLRAVRKIRRGQEITLKYNNMLEPRDIRRTELKETFNFACSCQACDLTEEEVRNETKVITEYQEERKRHMDFKQASSSVSGTTAQVFMKSEANCLKEMYKIAKEIRIINRKTILFEIVEEAFGVSLQGGARANTRIAGADWRKDTRMFANIGHVIAKTLFGEEHSETKKWRARSDVFQI